MAAGSARGTAWQDGARRVLEYAIAASLALHGLALLSLPLLPSPQARSVPVEPPLEARLVPQQPVAVQPPPPPAPVIEQVPPPPPKPRPAPRPAVKKAPPEPRRVHRPAPKRVREPVPEISVPASATAPAPPLPEPAAPAPVIAAPTPAPAPAPAARAVAPVDTASLVAQYRAEIISQAKRYKRYPRFARDNGWEGKVDVRMEIGADGSVASLRVVRGTGYSILDQQALDMVRRAKPDAAIPGGLRGKAFGIDVPVIFSLRDADG